MSGKSFGCNDADLNLFGSVSFSPPIEVLTPRMFGTTKESIEFGAPCMPQLLTPRSCRMLGKSYKVSVEVSRDRNESKDIDDDDFLGLSDVDIDEGKLTIAPRTSKLYTTDMK